MKLSFKHLISATQLMVSHVEGLIEKADEYMGQVFSYSNLRIDT